MRNSFITFIFFVTAFAAVFASSAEPMFTTVSTDGIVEADDVAISGVVEEFSDAPDFDDDTVTEIVLDENVDGREPTILAPIDSEAFDAEATPDVTVSDLKSGEHDHDHDHGSEIDGSQESGEDYDLNYGEEDYETLWSDGYEDWKMYGWEGSRDSVEL